MSSNEEKLAAIAAAMQTSAPAQYKTPVVAPVNPADQFACEGCQ